MALFKCKMCGGNLEVAEGMTVCECEYCGTKQTVPKTRDDVMSNLFNRANNLRIKCEFDKAQEIYDKIVASDPSESEAYWGIVLCKYGIEYVEDPATYKKVPTCHRTQLESVMTDVDFLAAVEHADVVQRSVYEEEARAIDKLQKDILEIVHKEQPFDVFICYKETDESGKRTTDSVIANDIYHQLTTEGFKVFYAAITLEDKLGQEYEPYIFAALNSAKVMLVIGSKPEYFNAVWVKNEWSRYMKLMKSDRSKLLIPCYKDMDAYDLPEEFSHLQAQDMSKIGFINDVIRGIKKIIVKEEAPKAPAPAQTVVTAPASANVENLLKRGMLSLEDGKWDEANKFFEQVLNENVEEPRAYFGKMLSSLKARSEKHLLYSAPTKYFPLTDNEHYKKAVRFAGEEYKAYLIDLNKRYVYSSGMKIFNSAKKKEEFLAAKDIFEKLPDYQPAKEKSAECNEIVCETVYNNSCGILSKSNDKKQLESAMREFSRISDYKDSAQKKAQCEERIKEIDYALAMQHFDDAKENNDFVTAESKFLEAKKIFDTLGDYSNAREMSAECSKKAVESAFAKAMEQFNSAKTESDYLAVKAVFDRISDYQPATEKSAECDKRIEQIHDAEKESKYQDALSILTSDSSTEDDLRTAISRFRQITDWKDSEKRITECQQRIDEIRAENERRRIEREQEAERQKQIAEKHAKRNKLIAALCTVAVLAVGFVVVFFTVIKPNQENKEKYNNAVAMLNEAKFDEARTAFVELGSFNNSSEMIKETDYRAALALKEKCRESGDYDSALNAFLALRGYKDCNDIYLSLQYDYACYQLENKEYLSAIESFEGINGYQNDEVAKKILEAKYGYVKANYSADDETTYEFLKELISADYPGAQSTYDSLYQWKADVYFNNSEDSKERMTSISKWGKWYTYIILSGGAPNGYDCTTIKYKITYPDGSVENNKSATKKESSEGIKITSCYNDPQNGKTGVLKVEVYDGSGNFIGTGSVKITE